VAVFIAEMDEQSFLVVFYAQPVVRIADLMQDAWRV